MSDPTALATWPIATYAANDVSAKTKPPKMSVYQWLCHTVYPAVSSGMPWLGEDATPKTSPYHKQREWARVLSPSSVRIDPCEA